jgi:hypothetical protein
MLEPYDSYFLMMPNLYKTLQKLKLQCDFFYVCPFWRGIVNIPRALIAVVFDSIKKYLLYIPVLLLLLLIVPVILF